MTYKWVDKIDLFNNFFPMSENQEKPIVKQWDETNNESWAETIEDTKQQLAEIYLNFLDQQKGGILATGASLGVNLNPLKKDALEYLTAETNVKEKKDILSKLRKNIKKKSIEKISWWTFLEYNKTSLNKMKALIDQYKNDQKKLQELMTQIQAGTDPTIETTIPNSENKPSVDDNKKLSEIAPWAAVVANTWILARETKDKGNYMKPIEGKDAQITSKFGKRTDPITGEKDKQHNGIDITMPKKTPIHSIASGKVIKSEWDTNGGGNYISIQWDDGKVYSYLHLYRQSNLDVWDTVKAGDEIGKVGSTGKSTWPHLHVTIKENDIPVDPLAALPQVFDGYTMKG